MRTLLAMTLLAAPALALSMGTDFDGTYQRVRAQAFSLSMQAPVPVASRIVTAPQKYAIVGRRTITPGVYSPALAPAPIVVPLTLLVEENSPWNAPGTLEIVLAKASRIFSQCRVTLGDADVLTVRWTPAALAEFDIGDTYSPRMGLPEQWVINEPYFPDARPLGLLFKTGSIPSTARATSASSVLGYISHNHDTDLSRRERNVAMVRRAQNTFVMTYDHQYPARPDPSTPVAPSHSSFAHELTHILGDLDHTPQFPNLMSDGGLQDGTLNAEQCARIRQLPGLPPAVLAAR